MGQTIRVSARDGHELEAYRARPRGPATGAVVVIQEIFGLTPHVLRVADRYAEAGFDAIAPAMFDRIRPGIVLDYGDIETGRATMRQLEWPNTLADVEAAATALGEDATVGLVGYCWGGSVVHVAASDLPPELPGGVRIAAGVSYYGAAIAKMLDKKPKRPVMYHFGDQDRSIPESDVAAIRRANPDAVHHVYVGAGHGFNCEDRASYSAKDAALAFERSLAFLREHLR